MASSFMNEINNRAENMRNINDMNTSETGGFFGDFKSAVENKYQSSLEDYADKLNRDISKEVATRGESVGILSNVPVFYTSGKSMYGSLGEKGRVPFDYVGEKVQSKFGDQYDSLKNEYNNIKTKIGDTAEDFSTKVKNFPEHIRKVMSKAKENDIPLVEENDGVLKVNLLEAERVSPNTNLTANQMKKIQSQKDSEKLQEQDEPVEPKQSSTIVDRDEVFQSSSEADEALQSTSDAALKSSTIETALDVDAELGAATSETGVGEVVAGVGLAAIGVVAGLTNLFAHHSHHPTRPNLSVSQPVFQTRYNPSAAVLGDIGQTSKQATYSF